MKMNGRKPELEQGSNSGMRELKIELWGRVQGVNFRNSISSYAKALDIKGYVKNRTDGSVLVIALGQEPSLEELLGWCQKSVFPARVTGMSYEWREPSARYSGFSIRKDKGFIPDQAQSMVNLGKEVLGLTDPAKVPTHVVIVADGNRRWARSHGWKPWVGHRMAAQYERVKPIFDECKTTGVKYLSLWIWSTENWDRDPEEIEGIFNVFRELVHWAYEEFPKEHIRFRHIGRKDRLPKDIVSDLVALEERSKEFTKLNLQLCMDYGGRDEIVRAVNGMIRDGVKDVTEKTVARYLDTNGIPDPDLVIRTSGEKRLSGIMPFQTTYSELYFTNVPFPAFGAEEFKRALLEYAGRVRRFGGTNTQDLKGVDVSKLYDPSKSVRAAE